MKFAQMAACVFEQTKTKFAVSIEVDISMEWSKGGVSLITVVDKQD